MNAEGAQRYILYYSKQCPHCSMFRQMLMKKPDLESKFVQLSVDTGIKLPRDVRSVPFIVVYDDKGRQLRLTDVQAFYWIRDQIDRLPGDFEAFDSGAMSSSLSDNFAFVGTEAGTGSSLISATGGLSHNYEFLDGHRADNRGGGMYTPKESEYGGGNNNSIPKNALERIIEQRNRDVPAGAVGPQRRPMEIDFSKPLPEVEREQNRLMHAQQQQRGLYTVAARRRDARIKQPRAGVDFGAPDFQAGLTQQTQTARQQLQTQTPMERAYQQRLAEQKQLQQSYRPQQLPQGRLYRAQQQPVTQYQPRRAPSIDPRRQQQHPQHPQHQQRQQNLQRQQNPQYQRPITAQHQQPRPGHVQIPRQQALNYNSMAGRGRPTAKGRGRPAVVAGRRLPAGWKR